MPATSACSRSSGGSTRSGWVGSRHFPHRRTTRPRDGRRMRKYLAHRLLIAIPTLVGVTLLIFVAMRVLPGDPLAAISGEGGGSYVLSQEQLQAARKSLGLDRPYAVQYVDWLMDVARGDLGKSFWRGEPIRELVVRRGPTTHQLAGM